MICPLCGEDIGTSKDTYTLYTPDGPEQAHRICMLRDVMGGIGHLIAHDWWCSGGASGKDDPDAGLTRYQSARLVDAYLHVVGIPDTPVPE